MIYLLDQPPTSSLGFTKLPKTVKLLQLMFHLLLESPSRKENSNPLTLATKTAAREAATQALKLVKAVWRHHFGIKLIDGKVHENSVPDKKEVMIRQDNNIVTQILNLFQQWKYLEQLSRRPDRSEELKGKEAKFKSLLDQPFNLLKKDGELILCQSGLKSWEEELTHLRNQLDPRQVGSCEGYDIRQKKKEERLLKDKIAAEKSASKVKLEAVERNKMLKEEAEASHKYENCEEEGKKRHLDDPDFCGPKKRLKKIDIMGAISRTSDARGLSLRDRIAVAASVTNAIGVDLNQTNINLSSAHRRAKAERIRIAKSVKEEFKCPDLVSLHWDGKTLTIKGKIKSNRIAVYLTGTDGQRYRKLLGIPETPSGSGEAEAGVVKKALMDWDVKKECINLVFDTTSSNSSPEVGACMHLELYVGHPMLWSGCRHHVYELYIKKASDVIMGATESPGVPLFKRLEKAWHQLEIDYEDLRLFDYSSVPEWLAEEAEEVMRWGEEMLAKGTWPRADYQEFLQLVVVALGGRVEGFRFRLPGADHHARWMSKGIYFLKIWLLSKIFVLSEEEEASLRRIVTFTLILYAKAWLLAPLSASAARNDLTFQMKVLRYREVEPKVAYEVLAVIRRHQWYLTGQAIPLALADLGLQVEERENLARTIHSMPRYSNICI